MHRIGFCDVAAAMKIIVIFLLFMGLLLSPEGEPYIFPPFNKSDLSFGKKEIEERLKEEPSLYEKSLPELRSIMTYGDTGEQQRSAEILAGSGDEKTMLRLIYTLK